jgi:4-hydroxybenzoate polyprenyltransferase
MFYPTSIKKYFSMVKFAHTVFAMPFALTGYFLGAAYAGAGFDLRIFLTVVLCMVFARNAAMGFNRYADRFIDAKNPRTEKREIPLGIVRSRAALIFVAVNSAAFVAACCFLNPLAFCLSPVALLVTLGYSFAKRYTSLCHFALGAGLSLAPIGAYLAVTGAFAWLPLMFSFVVLLWSGGFDIIYALQDEDFDVRERLHSIPARMGARRALAVSSAVHAVAGILTVAIGVRWDFGLCYAIGAAIFLFLLLYQHLIVKPDDLSRVNAAFFTSNGVASIVFATFTILDMIL